MKKKNAWFGIVAATLCGIGAGVAIIGPSKNDHYNTQEPALQNSVPQKILDGLTPQEWGLLSVASYYADQSGPEGRANNNQAYRPAYLNAFSKSPFKVIAAIHDRMPDGKKLGGAAIVAFEDMRTKHVYVSMAGLEYDGHNRIEGFSDTAKDVVEVLGGDYNQTRALDNFMAEVEKKTADGKPIILAHSMANKSAMVLASKYRVILFEPRGISPGSIKAIAKLRYQLKLTNAQQSQAEVVQSLEQNAVIIHGPQSLWNRSVIRNSPIIETQIPTLYTKINKPISAIDYHRIDVTAAGVAGMLGQDFKVTLHGDHATAVNNRPSQARTPGAVPGVP